MSKNRQLTADFISDQFLTLFKANPNWSAKDIQDAVKEKYKVIITKWLAYKAKCKASGKLHGSMKEHYSKLGSYLEALKEANPESTFELVTVPPEYYDMQSDAEVFFRLFICFDALKKGGMLLVAVGRDANNQMYPVAWAVVEGENNDSWTWFMTELKKCLEVLEEGKGWTLVSDQQKGLLNAVALVWANAEHRNCARHIYANWHKKFKGDDLKELFWRAARSYNIPDYKMAIADMKELDEEATQAFMSQNPKCFCRCYVSTEVKSDIIVNNMAETFNGYILQTRSKHIINMLEDIRVAIMSRLVTKHNEMSTKSVVVCPRIQKKLDKEKDWAYKCTVYPSSNTLFQVKYIDDVSVDIKHKRCSCRKWDLTGIPCQHVCAVAGFLHRNAEEFVHPSYTKDIYLKSYEFTIPPVPSDKYWPSIESPLEPPPVKVGPGRPKKNRKKDPHEVPKKGKLSRHGMFMRCGNCKAKGHTRKACTEASAESSKQTKKRGRPKKNQLASSSVTTVETGSQQQSQHSLATKKSRGRPRKAAKTTPEA
ncbi:uncharacterized protein LOC118492469 [Helianthus annuus]|uniref:uncharacterized protein LOC118492469 n=1 Tax=Helianthus annuus TaxID=4232 RepID=UPI0016530213|nr:uncharacterized protein LOC118492469 [Helianthus annuus]